MIWRVQTVLPLFRAAVSVAWLGILVAAVQPAAARDGGIGARPSVLLINPFP